MLRVGARKMFRYGTDEIAEESRRAVRRAVYRFVGGGVPVTKVCRYVDDAAEAPCGAAENRASGDAAGILSSQASCAANRTSSNAEPRCGNVSMTRPPALLSETAATRSKTGCVAMSRNSSPPT